MPKTSAQIELPPKLLPVFAEPRGDLRYRGAFGGRGSAKSFTFAKMAAVWGYVEKLRILCTRELQNSIKESFHAELKNAIQSEPWLEQAYDVGVDYIKGKNGTEFIFKGLRHNLLSVKSLSKIDLCIVEEAEDIPEVSWQVLGPTIRQPKSEIWVIWNPNLKGSPVDIRFRQKIPKRSKIVELNYQDNPWFPDELEELRKEDRDTLDSASYANVWDGKYLERSEAQVFHNWKVEEFKTPKSAMFRFGADWGFAVDPTVLVRCFIEGRKLYIDYEAYQVGCEIMDTPDLFMTVPESEKWPIISDSARPETISHMKKNGYPKILPAIKGAKSVEDGIEWLKSFEIIIHPRCEHVIQEFTTYSYKVDKLTDEVLPVLEDKNNHTIDAVRYACENARRAKKKKSGKPKPKNKYIV